MTIPTNRQEFVAYCLRRLGAGAIDIEVTEEQADDRLDYSLRMFVDYHFEGTRSTYYKYQIQANNLATAIYDVTVTEGGTGYSNDDIVVFSPIVEGLSVYQGGTQGSQATANVVTDASGTLSQVTLSHNGLGYGTTPDWVILKADGETPSDGSGASLKPRLGGFIPIPDNIIGVVDIFPIGNQAGAGNMFNLRYQIVLNDLYMFNNLNIVPYVSAMYNVANIQEVLVGKQPIRYSRYEGNLYIDMDWSAIDAGSFVVCKAYEVIDPEVYPKLWSDPHLIRYYTAQLREQWGDNLSKYGNQALVGGNVLNGPGIAATARAEIAQIEANMQNNWWPIPNDLTG